MRASRGPATLGVVTALTVSLFGLTTTCAAPPLDHRFDDFASWVVFDRGEEAVPPNHPRGPSTVYLSARPASGTLRFPMGTRIIRVTSTGDVGTPYEAHAMVKVDPEFNALGSAGWEFYGLWFRRGSGGRLVPHVEWRGEGPRANSGYASDDGSVIFGCNTCHATATYNDSVLGDELYLSSF